MQFEAICMPAPTSPNSRWRSYSLTVRPFWVRAVAAARPPMPPPMMSTSARLPDVNSWTSVPSRRALTSIVSLD